MRRLVFEVEGIVVSGMQPGDIVVNLVHHLGMGKRDGGQPYIRADIYSIACHFMEQYTT